MCYKYAGWIKFEEAESNCKNLGAQLPIPRSDKELDDLHVTLSALGLTRSEINNYVTRNKLLACFNQLRLL